MKRIKLKPEKVKSKVKTTKVFKQLNEQQLESVVGGPITSRGTVTTVQSGA
ncbi:bacteriocin [Flavobacterium sp. AJR]|uniref:bacteriocin n=1 Tax=Flavobacterium sp. AJR TaxID=1979369 RepID=UPI000F4F83B5|nr:bacteriocin [Flavobacterium sp. AJR]